MLLEIIAAFGFDPIFHLDDKLWALLTPLYAGDCTERHASTIRILIVAGELLTRPRSSSIGSRVPRKCNASASACPE